MLSQGNEGWTEAYGLLAQGIQTVSCTPGGLVKLVKPEYRYDGDHAVLSIRTFCYKLTPFQMDSIWKHFPGSFKALFDKGKYINMEPLMRKESEDTESRILPRQATTYHSMQEIENRG